MSSIIETYKQFAYRIRKREDIEKDLQDLALFDDKEYMLEIVRCSSKSEALYYLKGPHIWISRVIKHSGSSFLFAEIKRR